MHDDVTRETTPCSISGLTCSHLFLCYSQSPLKKPIFMLSFRVLTDYGFICTIRWSYLPPAPDCPVVGPLAPTSHVEFLGRRSQMPLKAITTFFSKAGTFPAARLLSVEVSPIPCIASEIWIVCASSAAADPKNYFKASGIKVDIKEDQIPQLWPTYPFWRQAASTPIPADLAPLSPPSLSFLERADTDSRFVA